MVNEVVQARRDELARELRAGQEMLAELDAKRAELQETMLRISGAVQVLTELLEEDSAGVGSQADRQPGAGPAPAAAVDPRTVVPVAG